MSKQKEQAQKLYKLLCQEEEDIQQGLSLLETLISEPFFYRYFAQKVYVKPDGQIYHSGKVLHGTPLQFDTAVHILVLLFTADPSLNKSIQRLDLSQFSNKEMLPSSIGQLTHLEELHMNSASFSDKPTTVPVWLETLPNLKKLSICGWNLKNIPSYFEYLSYLRIRSNIQIPSIETDVLLTKSDAIQLAFLELYESTKRYKEKDALILKHLELLDETYLTVSSQSRLLLTDDFSHGPISFSSQVLFSALDFGYTINLKRIETVELDSKHFHYIQRSFNIRKLMINVENTKEILDFTIYKSLRYLEIHNMPRILKLLSIPNMHISGHTADFQELHVRKPTTKVYKGFFRAFEAWFRSRWACGLDDLTSLTYDQDFKSLQKHHQTYIFERVLASKLTDVMKEILDDNPSLQEEMLRRLHLNKYKTKGIWKNHQNYIGCWEYFYNKGVIKESNIYVESYRLPLKNMDIKNLYVHYVIDNPLNFSSMKIDFLKIRGQGTRTEVLQVLHPLTCTKLNIENVRIPMDFWDFVPKDIQELSLVSIETEDLPNLSQFTNLQTLKLINCGLTEIIDLPSTLTCLNISSNPIQNIPERIYELTSLKTLHMSKCNFIHFSPKIKQLENLTYLSLCSSLVQDLTPLTTLKNLQKLRIGFALPQKHPRHVWSSYPKVSHRPKIVPLLPKGLQQLKELYVHDLLCIDKHAYLEHTLEVLDLTNTTEFIGLHMVKEFGHIKSLIGGKTCQTLSRSCSVEKRREKYIVDFERFNEYKLCYASRTSDYESSKIDHGIKYYQKLQSKSDKMG
jgi:Leucine-rich repeat (LRR) protein